MYTASHGPDPDCQIVRTLDIVGEKWSLLIVRSALRGRTRFSEFRAALGAPTDVLTARLATLVERGILEKRPYREQGSRERFSYHLTPAGEGLQLVLAAMVQWDDEFDACERGPKYRVIEPGTDESLELVYVRGDGTRADAATLLDTRAVTAS